MLVVARFTVPQPDAADFGARARAALAALAGQPGHRRGRLGRAADDPTAWVLTVEWDSVGDYRRALSAYSVRVAAAPLLATAHDEPSGFELLYADGAGAPATTPSVRAADAETVAVGEAAGPAVPTDEG